jgi:hypothetical protein
MRVLPAVTPTLARKVWEQMAHPSVRWVAWKLRQSGRPVSHETINRWRSEVASSRTRAASHRAWAALDDAVPVLTSDPFTTAEMRREGGSGEPQQHFAAIAADNLLDGDVLVGLDLAPDGDANGLAAFFRASPLPGRRFQPKFRRPPAGPVGASGATSLRWPGASSA